MTSHPCSLRSPRCSGRRPGPDGHHKIGLAAITKSAWRPLVGSSELLEHLTPPGPAQPAPAPVHRSRSRTCNAAHSAVHTFDSSPRSASASARVLLAIVVSTVDRNRRTDPTRLHPPPPDLHCPPRPYSDHPTPPVSQLLSSRQPRPRKVTHAHPTPPLTPNTRGVKPNNAASSVTQLSQAAGRHLVQSAHPARLH